MDERTLLLSVEPCTVKHVLGHMVSHQVFSRDDEPIVVPGYTIDANGNPHATACIVGGKTQAEAVEMMGRLCSLLLDRTHRLQKELIEIKADMADRAKKARPVVRQRATASR